MYPFLTTANLFYMQQGISLTTNLFLISLFKSDSKMNSRNDTTLTNHGNSSGTGDTETFQIILGLAIFNGLVGFIGNLLFVWTIYKVRRMRTQSNLLLTNMAFADILKLTFFNFDRLYSKRGVIKNDLLCKFVGYMSEVSLQSSLILLIVITIQRYASMRKVRPVTKLDSEPNLRYLLLPSWILSFLLSCPVAVYTKLIFVTGLSQRVKTPQCSLVWPNRVSEQLYGIIVTFGMFFLTALIVLVCHCSITRTIKLNAVNLRQLPPEARHSSTSSVVSNPSQPVSQTQRSILILVVFATSYLALVAPIYGYSLVVLLEPTIRSKTPIAVIGALGLCYSFQLAFYPWLYGLMSKTLRNAFLESVRIRRNKPR